MKISKLSCKEVMQHICENLGEEKDSEKCQEIEAHIKKCDCCGKYHTSISKTIDLYKLCKEELSPEGHSRLMECLGLSEFDF